MVSKELILTVSTLGGCGFFSQSQLYKSFIGFHIKVLSETFQMHKSDLNKPLSQTLTDY